LRRVRSPDQARDLVDDQDQRERGEHLRQVVARVQRSQHAHLEKHADDRGRRDGKQHAGDERAGELHEGGGDERAQHVKRAVREVDHVHDAEHQREAGGEQEQHQPELQAVQRLLEYQYPRHKKGAVFRPPPRRTTSGNHFIWQSWT
jgi:hypothetical protein